MRILHTADLHIGKTVNGFPMLEDQRYVLGQMIAMVKKYSADAFIIAGDIYDRPVPSAEAVEVFHWFVQQLSELGVTIFCISGNHDSPERISFACEILGKHGVHFAGTYRGKCRQVTLQDEFGDVVFTLMPFVKPALLQENTSQKAVEHMLSDTFDKEDMTQTRQVLITHYFVANAGKGPELSDSESHVLVGGLDQVDTSVFAPFHYTALGHIHKPQRMDREETPFHAVIYAGSPLPYSFSECTQKKGVMLVELDQNGVSAMECLRLEPLHKMRKLKGKIEDLLSPVLENHFDKEDYLQVTLTNEEELIDPMGTLRTVYPNVMQIIFEKREKEAAGDFTVSEKTAAKTPDAVVEDFYMLLREKEMDEERKKVIKDIVKELL